MKNYINYISEKVNQIQSVPKSKDWKMKIIKETIEKIESNENTLSIRKSNNYINNIFINSELCQFYKSYYKSLLGITVKKLPIPNDKKVNSVFGSAEIMEEIFFKVDQFLLSDNILVKSYFTQLKKYLIYLTYFPHILEYRDKGYFEHFKIKLIDYLKDIDKKDKKELLDNQGLINHHLFAADSHDEIRSYDLLERTIKDMNSLRRINLAYPKWYHTNIEYKNYNKQFDSFLDFLRKYEWALDDIFEIDYVSSGSVFVINPNNYSASEEKDQKIPRMVFVGDFVTDYYSMVNAYKKYYGKI